MEAPKRTYSMASLRKAAPYLAIELLLPGGTLLALLLWCSQSIARGSLAAAPQGAIQRPPAVEQMVERWRVEPFLSMPARQCA
jgi:hypothetical protein